MFLGYCKNSNKGTPEYKPTLAQHLEIDKLFISFFSSIHYRFRIKMLDIIVEINLCRNSLEPLFQL